VNFQSDTSNLLLTQNQTTDLSSLSCERLGIHVGRAKKINDEKADTSEIVLMAPFFNFFNR